MYHDMVVEKRAHHITKGQAVRRNISQSQTHYTYNSTSTTQHLPSTALPARKEMVAILMNFIVDGISQ
eukprot:scaffold29598_cov139-Skeletonema_marinoi.AAC.1